jgi:hypothetical protein
VCGLKDLSILARLLIHDSERQTGLGGDLRGSSRPVLDAVVLFWADSSKRVLEVVSGVAPNKGFAVSFWTFEEGIVSWSSSEWTGDPALDVLGGEAPYRGSTAG